MAGGSRISPTSQVETKSDVAPFPGPGGKWQVSSSGGTSPRWRRDGNEIFYVGPDKKLMAVAVNGKGSTFEVGAVRALFQTRLTALRYGYDVSADGQRFLINTLSRTSGGHAHQRCPELASRVEEMTLTVGTKLGSYEVLSQIGAGGMGEVYQAHDSKLGRDVAIKVLPEAFAHDPERLARFQREAKLLAALNHPNIATIHGLEQSGGTSYLVMELVSGETLQERVKREGAVPIEEALTIAKQIAEALEAAHEKGIIHRDLKPANVKVTPEGKVKGA